MIVLSRGENGPTCWALRPVATCPDTCLFQWLLDTDLKGWIPQRVIDKVRAVLPHLLNLFFNDTRAKRRPALIVVVGGDSGLWVDMNKNIPNAYIIIKRMTNILCPGAVRCPAGLHRAHQDPGRGAGEGGGRRPRHQHRQLRGHRGQHVTRDNRDT